MVEIIESNFLENISYRLKNLWDLIAIWILLYLKVKFLKFDYFDDLRLSILLGKNSLCVDPMKNLMTKNA